MISRASAICGQSHSDAVLVGEQDEVLPVGTGKPRPAARVVQQHQREQPPRLRLTGQQRGEHPAEPERLRGQVPGLAWRAVPLVEDQVDDSEHDGEPVGQPVRGRAR